VTDLATLTDLPVTTGTWTVDPGHSGIFFQIRHLGLSNVRGRFNQYTATLQVGERLELCSVEAEVDMSSVDTNQADRDAHLLGTDFFDAEKHPTMTFRSTAVKAKGDDEYELAGDLTINGVTRPVVFDVEFHGVEVFPPTGQNHAGFLATATIKRSEFGIDFNMPLGMDKVALADKVKVELDLQFVAPADDS
jgi:polyisoprenoid-binding protein YceI